MLFGILFWTARVPQFPGWLRPVLCLMFPLLRWGIHWATTRPFRGAPLLLELLTERAFVCLVVAEFLTAPLRFICTPALYVWYWTAASLTVYLLYGERAHIATPAYARLVAAFLSLVGAGVIEAVQPPTPHRGLLTLAENTAAFIRDFRNPLPVPRYVPYPAKPKPMHKVVVIPPLVLPAMIPDGTPRAALNYYRSIQNTYFIRQRRYGTLYELQTYGASFRPPKGFVLAEVEQDEIGQPLNRRERAGLCLYNVEASAEKKIYCMLADRRASDWDNGWHVWDAAWTEDKSRLRRWPARQKLIAAPPDTWPQIRATKARLSRIRPTLERFVQEQHRPPRPAEALEKFPMLSHGELTAMDLLDGWGRPFTYEQGAVLRAISSGPDGNTGTPDDIAIAIEKAELEHLR